MIGELLALLFVICAVGLVLYVAWRLANKFIADGTIRMIVMVVIIIAIAIIINRYYGFF